MDKKETKKALLICFGFFVLFCCFLSWFGKLEPDNGFHYSMTNGDCPASHKIDPEGHSSTERCDNYPPLFHWLAKPFAFRESSFKIFTLFLFAFLTPLALYLVTRKAVTCWFYFSCSSYFFTIADGFYPQGLVILFAILVFATKNNFLRMALLLLAVMTHSLGLQIVGLAILLQLLKENNFGKAFFPAFCSPVWGNKAPAVTNTVIGGQKKAVWNALRINHLLSFFSKMCPLPFLVLALKGLWKTDNKHLLIFSAIVFCSAFVYGNRALYVPAFPMFIGLTKWFELTSARNKKLLLFGTMLFFAFLIEQWWAVSTRFFC